LFKESDEDVAKKVRALQDGGVTPVACIGETDAERAGGKTLEVVGRQLQALIAAHLAGAKLVIAYEPVWAIGTGKVPTLSEVSEVHAFIRGKLKAGIAGGGEAVPVLYGGSVTPANSKEFEAVNDVNGFLIGGASLKVASLLEIY
jgi:triosephosphate isomerase